jgi:hypothetical protein
LREITVTLLQPPPDPAGGSASPVSEYDLKIDAQVEKFLETKHKLVYFLVTASAAPIVAVVQFIYGKPISLFAKGLAVAGIATGILTAAFALRALQHEVASYRNHIEYRYARKTWESLTAKEQASWKITNKRATTFTRIAFALISLEFTFFAGLGVVLVLSFRGGPAARLLMYI